MKLQDQVCSLEQAKKLKELGVVADSVCSHVIHSDREPFVEYTSCMVEIHGWGAKEGSYSMPAYTVAELGVMMPDGAQIEPKNTISQIETFRSIGGKVHVCYADYSEPSWLDNEGHSQYD